MDLAAHALAVTVALGGGPRPSESTRFQGRQ